MTRDEILAQENPMAVLSGLLPHIHARIKGVGYSGLNGVEKTVFSIYDLCMTVDSGGFIQYFMNSSGDYCADAEDALEALGAKRAKEIWDTVSERVGKDGTSPDLPVRQARIAELGEDDWNSLDGQAVLFRNQIETVVGLLVEHCRQNRDQLRVVQ